MEQDTLNRAEFLAVMEHGFVPEGLGDDKPRTTDEVLRDAAAERTGTDSDDTPDPEAPKPEEMKPEEPGEQETGEKKEDPEET